MDLNKTKYSIILLALLVVILTAGVIYYSSKLNSVEIKYNRNAQRLDSLLVQQTLLQYKTDSLIIVANKLDSMVKDQEVQVIKVKESFVIFKSAEITDANDAFNYITNFINE